MTAPAPRTSPAASPSGGTAALVATDIGKTYGTNEVLAGVDLQVDRGEVVCLVGPSGAGKTTLLRCLSGLITPTTGEVRLGDQIVTGPMEDIAIVFQDYRGSLMPWLKVGENVTFPLEHRTTRAERKRIALDALAQVGLEQHVNKYPWQLSGGMQQRVAIARALAYDAPIMLMDEPFGSLDAQTRYELEDLTLRLRRELGITIIVVTHDIDEAVFLGDRVVVFGGRPSSVVDNVTIDLGDVRNQITTKAEPRFAELRSHVLGEITELAASMAAADRGR